MVRCNASTLLFVTIITRILVCRSEETTTCSDISLLGTPTWDRYSGSIDITIDDDCMYTWTATFKHDETLPLPDDPMTQCNPAVNPPILASDGQPYFAFRWSYIDVPEYFAKATGIDHISLDFNPCGHPPIGIFTAPHYDLHTYRVTPAFRTCMLCEMTPASPACDHINPQTTEYGKAFFTPVEENIPETFQVMELDAIPRMGGHAWDPALQPMDAASWTEPVMVIGTYNSTLLYYEPMPPLSFVTGDTDTFWEKDIIYAQQTIENLATYSSVEYIAESGFATFTFRGPSSICKEEFEELTSGEKTFWERTKIPDYVIWVAPVLFGVCVLALVIFQCSRARGKVAN